MAHWKSNNKNDTAKFSSNFVQVTEVIKEHIEGAELGRQHGKEVAYTLPLESVDKFVG